jgi:hypothetical protein
MCSVRPRCPCPKVLGKHATCGISPTTRMVGTPWPPPIYFLSTSRGHLCSANCLRRLSWASDVRLREVSGILKFRPHCVHTPTAGTVPSHLSTRRVRIAMMVYILCHSCATVAFPDARLRALSFWRTRALKWRVRVVQKRTLVCKSGRRRSRHERMGCTYRQRCEQLEIFKEHRLLAGELQAV